MLLRLLVSAEKKYSNKERGMQGCGAGELNCMQFSADEVNFIPESYTSWITNTPL